MIQPLQPSNDIMDFSYLKKQGIEEIQKLAGKLWTDYNFHDPGITILEVLSFALTELGYKSRYPVQDILTTSSKKRDDTLFKPHEILTTSPVNLEDIHKIILDLDGIKDAIIFPSNRFPEFGGVYDIHLELYPEYDRPKDMVRIQKQVMSTIHANRNLCEDFYQVNYINHVEVTFKIDVEVNDKQNISDIYLAIYSELFEYISPSVKFHSLQELLEKGYDTNQIFDGPLLKSGFLTADEFERLDTRNVISSSDIIHFILDIPGVEMINTLDIIDGKGKSHKWLHAVEKGKAFKINTKDTVIRLFRFGEELELTDDLTQEIRKIERKEDNRLQFKRLTFDEPKGTLRNLQQFDTIQNDFPEIYGIGHLGLPRSANAKRKGLAKQLKAYLLFYEQILANFYAQLANLNQIFSIEDIKNTYFGQALTNIPGIEYLYKPFIIQCIEQNVDLNNTEAVKATWKKYASEYQNILENKIQEIIEKPETFLDRRNRILDHLLARFSFNYSDYFFDFGSNPNQESEQLYHKRRILKNYIELSKNRSKAFNVSKFKENIPENISGVEYRINTLLKLSGNSIEFPFDFYKNALKISSATETSQSIDDDLPEKKNLFQNNIRFLKTNPQKLLKNLFSFGGDFKQYRFEEKQVVLSDNKQNDIAIIDISNLERDEAFIATSDLAEKITFLSKKSEAIFFIERILYRPHPEMRYFTFSVLYADKTPAYINNEYLTSREREIRIEEIVRIGQKKENYNYKKISNQYKVTINNDEGTQLLISHRFFNDKKSVQQEIEMQIEYFAQIANKKMQLDDAFKYYTKHYDIFNLLRNPYSHIVTVLIPNWPKKFQNESFRVKLIESIHRELPAHILPDIKLVGIDELVKITNLCYEYQSILQTHSPDFIQMEELSDKLFGYFLRQ